MACTTYDVSVFLAVHYEVVAVVSVVSHPSESSDNTVDVNLSNLSSVGRGVYNFDVSGVVFGFVLFFV